MTLPLDYLNIDKKLNTETPKNILKYALSEFDNIALSFSGAEDVVLVDMASKIKPGVDVFCLDTGRLHKETYTFIEKVREHYDISLKVVFPDATDVERLVADKGLFSFYKDGHSECCGFRKVSPLRKVLAGYDAWVTGQRKDQSPNTRTDIPVIQKDMGFSTDTRSLTKFNPLANWSSEEVWMYIRMFDVPYNPLHEQGFISIGCEPCTKPVHPGQHEREGRWWWEEATMKECGLHLEK